MEKTKDQIAKEKANLVRNVIFAIQSNNTLLKDGVLSPETVKQSTKELLPTLIKNIGILSSDHLGKLENTNFWLQFSKENESFLIGLVDHLLTKKTFDKNPKSKNILELGLKIIEVFLDLESEKQTPIYSKNYLQVLTNDNIDKIPNLKFSSLDENHRLFFNIPIFLLMHYDFLHSHENFKQTLNKSIDQIKKHNTIKFTPSDDNILYSSIIYSKRTTSALKGLIEFNNNPIFQKFYPLTILKYNPINFPAPLHSITNRINISLDSTFPITSPNANQTTIGHFLIDFGFKLMEHNFPNKIPLKAKDATSLIKQTLEKADETSNTIMEIFNHLKSKNLISNDFILSKIDEFQTRYFNFIPNHEALIEARKDTLQFFVNLNQRINPPKPSLSKIKI